MNEQQLADRLTRAAEALPGPAATSLAGIGARALRRRRRRQLAVVAAVLPAVILGGVVVAQVLPPGPQQPIIEPLGGGSEAVGYLELADDAVWRSPEVADVNAAVALFAEQALKWPDATVEVGTTEFGPVWVTVTGPEQRSVEGLFTPTPQDGVWQLMQLGATWSGAQQFAPWRVALGSRPEATSADMYVRYEGQTWNLPLDDEHLRQQEVRLADHGLPEGGQIDAVLIVYRDAAGTTLDAVGGHFSNGNEAVDPDPFPADPELTEQFETQFTACMAEQNILVERVEAIVSSEGALSFRGWAASDPLPGDTDTSDVDCENSVMNELGLHPYIDSE